MILKMLGIYIVGNLSYKLYLLFVNKSFFEINETVFKLCKQDMYSSLNSIKNYTVRLSGLGLVFTVVDKQMTASINTNNLIIIFIVIIAISATILVYKNHKIVACTDSVAILECVKSYLNSSISKLNDELIPLSNEFGLYNNIEYGIVTHTLASTTKTPVFLPGTLFKSPTDLVFRTTRGPAEFSLSYAPYWKLDVKRIDSKSRAIIFGTVANGNIFNFEITPTGYLRLYYSKEQSRDVTINRLSIIGANYITISLQFDFTEMKIYILLDNIKFYVPFSDLGITDNNFIIKDINFGKDNKNDGISNIKIKNCIVGSINMYDFNDKKGILRYDKIDLSVVGTYKPKFLN